MQGLLMAAQRQRRRDDEELVAFKCRCGKKWRQMARHYDVIMCQCQQFVWALRPQQGGPLVSFFHPGFYAIPGGAQGTARRTC